MLNIWFIDDNDAFLKTIRTCLGVKQKSMSGVYKNSVSITILDANIDGSSIVNTIRDSGHKTSHIPDFVFLDLRFPIDKRQASTNIDNDPLKLSGIKILDAIIENDVYKSTIPIIFTAVSLDQHVKDSLTKRMSLQKRRILIKEKFPDMKDMNISIDGIDGFIASKNCDSLQELVEKLLHKMGK
ncbi:MAG: hypothetical protein PHX13_00895 [Thiovulaceae bacterium]|nr:hypothetical protein [Sulfurimonadaceae bacterium]